MPYYLRRFRGLRRRPELDRLQEGVAGGLLGGSTLSNATFTTTASLACFLRHYLSHAANFSSLHYSPLFKNTCAIQVVLHKWFPLSLAGRPSSASSPRGRRRSGCRLRRRRSPPGELLFLWRLSNAGLEMGGPGFVIGQGGPEVVASQRLAAQNGQRRRKSASLFSRHPLRTRLSPRPPGVLELGLEAQGLLHRLEGLVEVLFGGATLSNII